MATMLGQLLVEEGAATPADLDAALVEQRETRERIGVLLSRRGVDAERVARALATQLRLDYAAPPLLPEPDAVGLLPRPHALRLRVLPLDVSGRGLRVAMADPLDAAAIDHVQFRTGRRAEPVVASEAALDAGLVSAYGDEAVRSVIRRLPGADGGAVRSKTGPPAGVPDHVSGLVDREEGAADGLREASQAPPVIALVNLLLERAVAAGASDIHVEPARDRLRFRARVDGVLRELLEAPASSAAGVVSRLKIMAGLDIAVKRRPQDGRSAVRIEGRSIGLRVSTLPAQEGEKVVLRLLDPRGAVRSLDGIGADARLRAELDAVLTREHGLFLVTGPTGSGKTTTLYAILGSRDRAGRNIVTLEDPVEYRLEGLTQVQVQPRAGLTFPVALRSVLRQDPDIVMVGEMRDRETVEVGLAAALTGHLVLSTLHTNDASSAVARLVEMGAARYLVAGGLAGVLAQRLVRRICPDCATIAPVSGEELYDLGLPTPPHLPRPVGCDRCQGTGYRGRVGIFELLRVTPVIRELVLEDAPVDRIREAAAASGARSLAGDAWARVEAGLTTLDEVRPLLALLRDEAPACRACGGRVARSQAFCPHCGGETVRRCGCGETLRPHWRFCGGCGESVRGAGGEGRRGTARRASAPDEGGAPARDEAGRSGQGASHPRPDPPGRYVSCSSPSG